MGLINLKKETCFWILLYSIVLDWEKLLIYKSDVFSELKRVIKVLIPINCIWKDRCTCNGRRRDGIQHSSPSRGMSQRLE